jgi:hypothetical protein
MRPRHQDHRLPAVAVRVAGLLFSATSPHFSDLQMSDRLRPRLCENSRVQFARRKFFSIWSI